MHMHLEESMIDHHFSAQTGSNMCICGEAHRPTPVVHTIGGVVIRHGERDDSELCLCGHDPYYTCPDWLNDGSIGHLTFRATS
jgi:hypothetical protein